MTKSSASKSKRTNRNSKDKKESLTIKEGRKRERKNSQKIGKKKKGNKMRDRLDISRRDRKMKNKLKMMI